jgi:ATP-binding cassette subfamily F protein uup
MPVLDAVDLRKSYGATQLLDGVTLTLRRGERVGLVGSNGSGKSTLSRVLAGLEDPDSGEIARRRGSRIEYLAQEPVLPAGRSVLEVTLEGLGAWARAKQEYEELSARLAAGDASAELLERQEQAAAEVERLGGWERSNEAGAVLSRLGVTDTARNVDQLSGGERRRVALARLLVAKPDLAILDEPTNHLDAETIEWLETYLVEQLPGALLLITHDRYLLDRVVTRTLEIDRGKVYSYEGGWEDFLVARAERQAQAERTEANRQNFLRRELEWLRRQPKARTGKQKARIQRAEEAQAVDAKPARGDGLELRVASKRLGATILEAHDLAVEIGGRRLVDGLTLHLTRGERIGIIGRNGAGKTTLVQCLLGQRTPAGGRVVHGKNTSFAYFDQARSGLDPTRNVLETVTGDRTLLTVGGQTVSSYAYLERFWLGGDKLRQPVGSLSGGERARVVLAKLLLEPANVLVLDEPTNDLDVTTLGALEEMLIALEGSALIVSHDRYFLDRVATSLLVVHGDGRVTHVPGTYSSYAAARADAEREEARQRAEEKSRVRDQRTASQNVRKGLTYAERLELDGLLDRVEAAAARVSELEGELADPSLYAERYTEAAALEASLKEARAEAERLESRWLELEEKRENSGQ